MRFDVMVVHFRATLPCMSHPCTLNYRVSSYQGRCVQFWNFISDAFQLIFTRSSIHVICMSWWSTSSSRQVLQRPNYDVISKGTNDEINKRILCKDPQFHCSRQPDTSNQLLKRVWSHQVITAKATLCEKASSNAANGIVKRCLIANTVTGCHFLAHSKACSQASMISSEPYHKSWERSAKVLFLLMLWNTPSSSKLSAPCRQQAQLTSLHTKLPPCIHCLPAKSS